MVDKLFDIKVGDRFYVNEKFYKMIFNKNFGLVYKPNKFYTVFNIDKTKIKGSIRLSLTTSSEKGFNRIILIKNGEIKKHVEHFNFFKKEDYEEVTKIEYFQDI